MTRRLDKTPTETVLDFDIPYLRLYICALDGEVIADVQRRFVDLDGNVFHNSDEADQYWQGNDFLEMLAHQSAVSNTTNSEE